MIDIGSEPVQSHGPICSKITCFSDATVIISVNGTTITKAACPRHPQHVMMRLRETGHTGGFTTRPAKQR